MQLRIKPCTKNQYQRAGILIKGSSLYGWLKEMDRMKLVWEEVLIFPLPARIPNEIYGCLLILKVNKQGLDLGASQWLQLVDGKLYIPRFADYFPKIGNREWEAVLGENPWFFHPETGLFELNEPLNIELLLQAEPFDLRIESPVSGVVIPRHVKSFTIEIDDEKLLETLENPKADPETLKNLPFDMKKLLSGNKKELEKYLSYIKNHPEKAVELGIPLDTLNASRENSLGQFSFSGWRGFGGLSGGRKDNNTYSDRSLGSGSGIGRWRNALVIGLLILFFFKFITLLNRNQSENTVTANPQTVETMATRQIQSMKEIRINNESIENVAKIDSFIGFDADHVRDSLSKVYRERFSVRSQIDSLSMQASVDRAVIKLRRNKIQLNMDQIKENHEIRNQLVNSSYYNELNKTRQNSEIYGDVATVYPASTGQNNTVNSGSDGYTIVQVFWIIAGIIFFAVSWSFFSNYRELIKEENVPLSFREKGSPIFKTLLLWTLIILLLIYVFYPLLNVFGIEWYVVLLSLLVSWLIYRLISDNKSLS